MESSPGAQEFNITQACLGGNTEFKTSSLRSEFHFQNLELFKNRAESVLASVLICLPFCPKVEAKKVVGSLSFLKEALQATISTQTLRTR